MNSHKIERISLGDQSVVLGEISAFLPSVQKYYITPKARYTFEDIDLSFPVSEIKKTQEIKLKKV